MSDYIRKGVELADGWSWSNLHEEQVCILAEGSPYSWHVSINQIIKDALAAQLVRQMQAIALERKELWIWTRLLTQARQQGLEADLSVFYITYIVDSKILEK